MRVELKLQKCPTCGDALEQPKLNPTDATIRVVCRKSKCGYSMDLGWLGDISSGPN